MRILILCDVLFPQTTGGAGRVARELGTCFQRKGHDVHFLTRRVDRALSPPDINTTYFTPTGGAAASPRGRIFASVLDSFRPDLLLVHQPLGAFLALPSRLPVPMVYVFHSSWPEEVKVKHSQVPLLIRRLAAPLLTYIERSVLSKASAVVALSRYSHFQMQSRYGLSSHIIPGGVDSGRFVPLPRRRSNESLDLVTLRNLVPRMGLSELIRSMTLLPDKVRLKVGGKGPLRSRLEQLVAELGLENRVRLAGHVADADLPCFYSSADWFILPTAALEGFGLVVLESLSCGTPVLGTPVGAIPELLKQFDPAWVMDTPSHESIATAIRKAAAEPPPNREKLHQLVAERYDWSRIAEQYLKLFQQVISG